MCDHMEIKMADYATFKESKKIIQYTEKKAEDRSKQKRIS